MDKYELAKFIESAMRQCFRNAFHPVEQEARRAIARHEVEKFLNSASWTDTATDLLHDLDKEGFKIVRKPEQRMRESAWYMTPKS